VEPPETRYAKSGDVSVAYQVLGKSNLDLVYVPGFVSNLDRYWENPIWVDLFSRITGFSRLILFDKRGTGLSDRVAGVPDLEVRMDDVRAVMDAVGSERATLFGQSRRRCDEHAVRRDLPGTNPCSHSFRDLCPSCDLGALRRTATGVPRPHRARMGNRWDGRILRAE